MKRGTRMKSKTIDFVREQVDENISEAIINVIATQIERANEARKKIDEEGIVVRDMKGSVIAHPALKIEIDAGKIIADLMKKHER